MKKILLISLILLTVNVAHAYEKAGEIIRYKGAVVLYPAGGVRGKHINKDNLTLHTKDIVKSKRNGIAHIKFIDQNKVILTENSLLKISGLNGYEIGKGKVLFDIKKMGKLKGLVVKTKSVVIGIRGTRFMVDTSKDKVKLYLQKGKLNIKPVKGTFVRYKKSLSEEFDSYKNEFDTYKKEISKEFKEFVKEFEMKEGTAVIIDGNEVTDTSISPEIDKEFKLLDTF